MCLAGKSSTGGIMVSSLEVAEEAALDTWSPLVPRATHRRAPRDSILQDPPHWPSRVVLL